MVPHYDSRAGDTPTLNQRRQECTAWEGQFILKRTIKYVHLVAAAGLFRSLGESSQQDPAAHPASSRVDAGDALGLPHVAPELITHPFQLQ